MAQPNAKPTNDTINNAPHWEIIASGSVNVDLTLDALGGGRAAKSFVPASSTNSIVVKRPSDGASKTLTNWSGRFPGQVSMIVSTNVDLIVFY